jgi:hypothetical protein
VDTFKTTCMPEAGRLVARVRASALQHILNAGAAINVHISKGLYRTSRIFRRTACRFCDACVVAVAAQAMSLSRLQQTDAL